MPILRLVRAFLGDSEYPSDTRYFLFYSNYCRWYDIGSGEANAVCGKGFT